MTSHNLSAGATWDADQEDRLAAKVMWRIMPLLILCMITATIDRSNIGFAKLGMRADLGISESAFGLGASLFFIGYVAFEIPSTLGAHRFGVRVWFARILATWGLATLLLAFVQDQVHFYVLRFVLGMAEAGLYPAQVYYLTLWFGPRHRARALGLLTLGSAFGNALSALVCGPLLELRGVAGFAGWQWIFLVTGALPMLTLIAVLRFLPDSPARAHFLSEDEARAIAARPNVETTGTKRNAVLAALLDPRILALGLIYGLLTTSLYAVIYWAPSVFSSFGLRGTANGLLIALPWLVDAVLLVTVPRLLRTPRQTTIAGMLFSTAAVLSFALSATAAAPLTQLLALLVGIPMISLSIACFWPAPMAMFSGAGAAAAIAAVSTIANLGGFVAQNAMPLGAAWGGSVSAAMWIPAAIMAVMVAGFPLSEWIARRRPCGETSAA